MTRRNTKGEGLPSILSTIETFDAAFNSVSKNFHFSELIGDCFSQS